MSKLFKQDKIDIYNSWEYCGKPVASLIKECSVTSPHMNYLIDLIDRYGIKILDRGYMYYSVKFKKQAIKRTLSKK